MTLSKKSGYDLYWIMDNRFGHQMEKIWFTPTQEIREAREKMRSIFFSDKPLTMRELREILDLLKIKGE